MEKKGFRGHIHLRQVKRGDKHVVIPKGGVARFNSTSTKVDWLEYRILLFSEAGRRGEIFSRSEGTSSA